VSLDNIELQRNSGALYYNPQFYGSNPDEVIWFFNWPNPTSRTMAPGATQSLTEMSTWNLTDKGRPARKAHKLTAFCQPIMWKMWAPRHLTTWWAFTACYKDSYFFSSFHWGKRGRGVKLAAQPHLVPRLRMLEIYLPPIRLRGVMFN
jgi:hypothetical protein